MKRSEEQRERRRLAAYIFRDKYRAQPKPLIVGKRCSSCKQFRAGVDFYGRSCSIDGLVPSCKPCVRVQRKSPETMAANRKRCAAYRKTKAGRAADRRGQAKFRKTPKGRQCALRGAAKFAASGGRRAMLLRWQSRPEVKAKLRENCRRYHAMKRAAFVEVVSPSAIFAREDGACWMCRTPLTLLTMQIDHVIPLSRGGEHSNKNCKASCQACNLRKSNKLPSEIGIAI